MNSTKRVVVSVAVFFLTSLGGLNSYAQGLLDKTISVDIKKAQLKEALDMIGKQGHFYFSYNSLIVKKDSLVNVSVHDKTVKQTLDMLLGESYQYKEIDNHIVIQPLEKERWYTISGHITDAATGQMVADASVFERQQLVATLSDPRGYFKLRLKDKERFAAPQISVSKGFYVDTNVVMDKGYDQEIALTLAPADHTLPDIVITQYSKNEKTWWGKLLFSNKLRKQSLNLEKFFIDEPIQISLIPGLGTHGKVSSQVVNTFSFNVLGGYSAGVDGLELGGIFNIDKKDVQYVQAAGIFNLVSGNVRGVQMAGIMNQASKSVVGVQLSGIAGQVMDGVDGVVMSGISSYVGGSVRGVQISGITGNVMDSVEGVVASGISSYVGRRVSGVQISGIANMINNSESDSNEADMAHEAMHGVQIAGIVNVVDGHSRGVQIAGVTNMNRGDIHGAQMSWFLNVAKRVEGSQIGFINIADTVTGYCFGVLNIVKHGYHILSVSTTEMLNVNATYKAGNRGVYSILGGGMNTRRARQIYSISYGIGKEISLRKKMAIALEITSNHMYPSSKELNIAIIRFEPTLNWRPHKLFSIYTGPAISFCPATRGIITDYFPTTVPANALYSINTGGTTAAWIGWKAGVDLF